MFDFFVARGLPWSLGFFALTLLVYLLQRFPFTGIFLMLVMAPFWSVVLVNLGFVGLGIEAAVGRVPRIWGLAPILWFGGYWAVLAAEDRIMAAERSRLAGVNAVARFVHDPARHDIIVEKVAGEDDYLASGLLQHHDIQAVYSVGDHGRYEGPRIHQMLDWKVANGLAKGFDLVTAGITTRPVPTATRRWGSSSSLLELAFPAEPQKPAVRIAAGKRETRSRFTLAIDYTPIEIRVPGEAEVRRLTSATAAPLPPLSDAGDGLHPQFRRGEMAVLPRFPSPQAGCARIRFGRLRGRAPARRGSHGPQAHPCREPRACGPGGGHGGGPQGRGGGDSG